MKTETQIIRRLRQSAVFRNYAGSFEELTGLPLSLCSLEQWPPARRGLDCENEFCRAMLRSGHACVACEEVERELCAKAVDSPRSVTCLGGVCDTGVPVRLNRQTAGFLVVGPILLHAPNKEQLSRTIAFLKHAGLDPDRARLSAAYFGVPFLAPERHASIARMLIVFAEHLSLLGEQILLEQDPAEPAPVRRARRFIAEHHARPLRLEDAARSANLSTTYFSRMFKKSTAVGFSEYLTRVRIAQARNLLLNPDMNVSEIAFAVGFQSVPHFNRVFKRLVGKSPTEFRGRRKAA